MVVGANFLTGVPLAVTKQVRLRSFTTKVHKVDAMVAYKSVDDDDDDV